MTKKFKPFVLDQEMLREPIHLKSALMRSGLTRADANDIASRAFAVKETTRDAFLGAIESLLKEIITEKSNIRHRFETLDDVASVLVHIRNSTVNQGDVVVDAQSPEVGE